MSPPNESAKALERLIERMRAVQRAEATDPALAARLHELRTWQAGRLSRSYADLAADPRQAPAIRFFLSDLYGPQDFSQRDRDLMRASIILEHTLPQSALSVLIEALELNVLSAELDHGVARSLAAGPISNASYAQAYRQGGHFEERRRQIELIVRVGERLAQSVRQPLVGIALRAARGPAHMAGFGALQDFLERGFKAFRKLGSERPFLDTIRLRETALSEALARGDAAALD